ncbi:MAG: hypothetical protein H6974_09735 [Gammaproteobacteria bacterium]|nr:hypothetical protein [Gammaproteobacteria bacterium]
MYTYPPFLRIFIFSLSMAVLLMPAFHTQPVQAAAISPAVLTQIPVPLHPWLDWALRSLPQELRCPIYYDQAKRHRCVWATALELRLDAQGGEFNQRVHQDAEDWLTLPGDRRYWPQSVRLNDLLVPVLERDGRPALKASAGEHVVTGRFFWNTLPESIRVPPDNALLDLWIDGQPTPVFRLEDDGVLWLRQGPTEPAQQDALELQVFRLLSDGIPFTVATHLELKVSGQVREELLGPVLLPDFLPLALNSPLPVRLETDGRLRVQLRPGTWTIDLTARHRGPLDALTLPTAEGPWPTQEIWSFQAQNALRVVAVEGAPALDPTQTHLPEAWRSWPAYLLRPGETLRLTVRTRGAAEPSPERLTLSRILWLDFAGSGYTVQDRLSGTLETTRLNAASALQLGRVAINGEDQFITQTPGVDGAGVEIRRLNNLQLTADSRLEPEAIEELPAVGWRIAPQRIDTTLHLPPGWRLLATEGPDRTQNAWLYSWNLLDLFIVLVVALAFSKLWNIGWGCIALTGMTLVYHEPNAPLYIWLNILAAIALLRVLPSGWLHNLVNLYRRLALLGLLIIGGLFAVQQVRSALYPQLEAFAFGLSLPSIGANAPPPAEAPMAPVLEETLSAYNRAPSLAKAQPVQDKLSQRLQQQYAVDIKVQTGPGVPAWSWQQAILHWSGPVAMDERLRLWLLPPWGTRALMLAGLLLVMAMTARVFPPRRQPSPPEATPHPNPLSPEEGESNASAFDAPAAETREALPADRLPHSNPRLQEGREVLPALLGLLVGGWLCVAPTPAQAEFPSPKLLQELRDHLTQPPDCQRCGDLAALALNLKNGDLRLQLSLQAQTETAIPLPLPQEGLIIRSVALDGQPAILFRDSAPLIWLRLPAGLHELTVIAMVPATVTTLQLPLPMAPGRVTLNVDGWRVEGYVEGRADRQLQLTRQRLDATTPLQSSVMPSFVQVERDIVLDVDWQVNTRVRRLSQADSAAAVEIPLLPGERITTSDIQVREGRVWVNLPPERAEISWSATLSRADELHLQAAASETFVEIWRLRAGPLWHVQDTGIPLVQRIDAEGEWTPEWRPWPGEQVTLNVTRPEGAPGNTVTIDRSHLQVTPGQRLSEAVLDLSIRASRGIDHTLMLPPGAILTGVRIDEITQPLQQQDRQVVLPLTPGAQRVVVTWRNEQALERRYATPLVDLGSPSVNSTLSLKLPHDRWLLWAEGPVLGPAVLFWGVLLVILVGAILLARWGDTPLRTHQWFLLGVGLSQSHVLAILLVTGWLLLLARRRASAKQEISAFKFDLWQIGLALLTLAALATLLGSVEQGLLGSPDMQVAGNGSSAWQLNWYQDRIAGALPTAWVMTVPLLVYRGLMLIWALWLALALLKWLSWGWDCFSTGGLWRSLRQPKT